VLRAVGYNWDKFKLFYLVDERVLLASRVDALENCEKLKV